MNKNGKETIKKIIEKYFKEILSFESSDLYLLGGALRECLESDVQTLNSKDLDFVLIDNSSDKIDKFIKIHDLKYIRNSFGGYKIIMPEKTIDIWNVTDLYKAMEFNLDGIFYNVKHELIIPVGYMDGVEKKVLLKLNEEFNHPDKERREARLKKMEDKIK